MKHTKQEIEAVIQQLMKDTDRKYYTDREIHINFENDKNIIQFKRIVKNCWLINVPVHDDQSNKEESEFIIIYIDDDTLEIIGYLDCSMGRPIPMIAKKMDNGKYGLGFPQ